MNQNSLAHDALEHLVRAAFPFPALVLRNPTGAEAPRAKETATNVAAYVALIDDLEPETLRVLCGPSYDLKVLPRVAFLYLGKEVDRRAAYFAASTTLAAALNADVSLGGVVEDARIDRPAVMDSPDHEWLAGGIALHVRLLFNANTAAG